MTYTKREIIDEAFGELALAGYVFDITSEEQDSALKRLDMMMATWNGRGTELGYQFGEGPSSTDLDDESGLPLFAVEAVTIKLAISIAAGKGKQVAATTKSQAKEAMSGMYAALAREKCLTLSQRDNLPPSAGNRRRGYLFHRPDIDSGSCT